MKNFIFKYKWLLLFCLAILIISGIGLFFIDSNDSVNPISVEEIPDTEISYPVSFQVLPTSTPTTVPTTTITSGYSAEIQEGPNTNPHYYSLIFTKNGQTKEIFKWEQDGGYGIGGPSCTGVKYSPDKTYFTACLATAVVSDHQWIPLIFNSEGELITDFAYVENFPTKAFKHTGDIKYSSGDTFLTSETYYVEFNWKDKNTLLLGIYNKEASAREPWEYSLITQKMIKV